MTKKQMEFLLNIKMEDLDLVKELIAKREEELWEPMWWTHECDQWFYYLYYQNGEYYMTWKGKEAYEKFMDDDRFVKIVRKTKNLFPTCQTIVERKVCGKGKDRVRYQVYEDKLPGLPLATS